MKLCHIQSALFLAVSSLSLASASTINPILPSSTPTIQGLAVQFWSTGSSLTSIAANDAYVTGHTTPTDTYRVNSINSPNNADGTLAAFLGSTGSNFASNPANYTVAQSYSIYSGYIAITSLATWNFELSSDDGSLLTINGNTIINNDGNHAFQNATGSVTFSGPGLYSFQLKYFENNGNSGVVLTADTTGGTTFAAISQSSLVTVATPEPSTFALLSMVLAVCLIGVRLRVRLRTRLAGQIEVCPTFFLILGD